MTNILITSAISMGVLLAVYHLLLEKEKMHRFNRFYLLTAVVFSLALPFITIEVYTEVAAETLQTIANMPAAIPIAPAPQDEAINYLPYVIWGIYSSITLLLILRFALNILRFRKKIRQNETVEHDGAVLVLLNEPVLPHTFLHYIFISKEDYEKRDIEEELFTHELAHVKQKHTLDILFIEGLKTLLWFNPFLYFYKKAMQLNHEFLADEIVVSTGGNVTGYQRLLLQKATPVTYHQLASSLNFSVTKKRFTMMTKATTRSRALVLKFSALPVLAALIALFCIETIAQEKPVNKKPAVGKTVKQQQGTNERRDAYFSGVRVIIDDKANTIKIDKMFEELTEKEKDTYMLFAPEAYTIKHPTKKEFESFKNKKGYALQIDGKNVDNAVLNNYKPEDFAYYAGYTMSREALTKEHPQVFHYQLYTPAYFEKHLKGSNDHYPDKAYTMIITKEIKDGKVVAEAEGLKTFDEVDKAMAYLQEDKIYSVDELKVKPEFPGGVNALYSIIAKNFRSPELDKDATLKIFMSFVVEKDGSMSNIKIVKDPGHGMGAEAERVLKTVTDKWKPGMEKDKPVRVSYMLPISINIRK